MRIYHCLDELAQNEMMLIDYYVSQYGEECRAIIQERSDKTIYLLDSPPDVTFQYLIQNQNYADPIEIENFENLSKDYCYLMQILTEEEQKSLYCTFCDYHAISSKEYSSKQEQILSIISKIYKGYALYKNECNQFGFVAIQDKQIFKQFSQEISEIKESKKINLLNQSLWGKKVKESFCNIGIKVSDETFSYFFNLDKLHVAHCINFSFYTFVYVPVIQLYLNGGYVDRVFLHENRHAIESGNHYKIGLNHDGFYYFNEFRTEMHAIEDNQVLPTLFSKEGEAAVSFYYEYMFPFLGDLLEEYQFFIDQCAIHNDIEKFLCIFGENDMREYSKMLDQNYALVRDFCINGSGLLEVDPTSCLEKVDLLKKHAKKYLKK